MTEALLLVLGATLHVIPSWIFMDHTFHKKHTGTTGPIVLLGSWAVFIVCMFTLPAGYAVCFPLYLILLFLLFKLNWRQAVFYASLLTALPAAIAGIVFPLAGCVFDGSTTQSLGAFAGSGAIYALLIALLCRLTDRYENPETPHGHLFLPASLVPLGAAALLCGWMGVTIRRDIGESGRILLACTALILFGILLLLLFAVWQSTDQAFAAQALRAQVRKNAIDHDILRESREQQERAAILVHDIRRNLSAIAALAEGSENEEILRYISSITQPDRLHPVRQYSGNRLVNDIVTRCCERCENSGIRAEIDIRNADFTFLSDSDLTAILDNLLENACEAAEKCREERWLRLQVAERNVRYLVIKVENSASKPPMSTGEDLQSSKQDATVHGYGTKIIRRAAQRYNGEARFTYDDELRLFSAIVILQHPL